MRYIINTLGCKVNQYETQAMETLLRERGHEPRRGRGRAAELRHREQLRRHGGERAEIAPGAARGSWSTIPVRPSARSAAAGRRRSRTRPRPWARTSSGAAATGAVLSRPWSAPSREQARARGIDKPFERRIIEDLPAGAFSGHAQGLSEARGRLPELLHLLHHTIRQGPRALPAAGAGCAGGGGACGKGLPRSWCSRA